MRKNRNLRTTRDLLLPKLISGKLDVQGLDIDVGMTAEALEEATT
jgi:type I restriction enzyme S subunit